VILAADSYEIAAETLGHLGRQTARERIEVVLAGPAENFPGEPPAGCERLHSLRVADADPRSSAPVARAAGIRAARAPVVAFSETHCFPEPDWAEALIAAHRGPWAAVSPEIHNENPGSIASWGHYFVDYAPWAAPLESEERTDLPGHNSSYKRELLLAYGDRLPQLLECESIMHWDLREHGHRLYTEAAAKVHHRNITKLGSAAIEHFHNGRCFGGLRARGWNPIRRLLYAAGSPLIPAIRLRRTLRDIRRTGHEEILPRALPMIVSSLITHALGEMTGYLIGTGGAAREMSKYELDRDLYVDGLAEARAGG